MPSSGPLPFRSSPNQRLLELLTEVIFYLRTGRIVYFRELILQHGSVFLHNLKVFHTIWSLGKTQIMLLTTTAPLMVVCALLTAAKTTIYPKAYYVKTVDVDSLVIFDSLYALTNITTSIPSICLSRVSFKARKPTQAKSHLLYLSQLLLLRASDTELNPGPRSVKFPCGVCEQGCYWRQRAICCEDCETWYHAKCIGMPEAIYLPLTKSDESFTCFNCGVPNLSSRLFDTVFANTESDCDLSSKSSIFSSDIPESSCSSPSCNISDLSNITNDTQGSNSFKLDETIYNHSAPAPRRRPRTN